MGSLKADNCCRAPFRSPVKKTIKESNLSPLFHTLLEQKIQVFYLICGLTKSLISKLRAWSSAFIINLSLILGCEKLLQFWEFCQVFFPFEIFQFSFQYESVGVTDRSRKNKIQKHSTHMWWPLRSWVSHVFLLVLLGYIICMWWCKEHLNSKSNKYWQIDETNL